MKRSALFAMPDLARLGAGCNEGLIRIALLYGDVQQDAPDASNIASG
jgi:hypothetical protein